MPWSVEPDHPDCPGDSPFAVVKNETGEVEGCHATRDEADDQVRALYASEDTLAQKTAPWRGPLAVEGITTGDGREFSLDSLTWADLPLPLRWNKEDSHGGDQHTVAVNVGRIDRIWRDGNQIMGEGVLNLTSEDGQRVFDMIKGQFLRGVSIDADSISDADIEFVWPEDDNDGPDEDDLFSMLFSQPEKIIFHSGRIRAATLVDIPAFAEAYIELLDESGSVVASARAAHFTAVGSHDTSTSEESWDGPENEKRLPSPMTVERARDAYAWIDQDRVEDGMISKDAARFIHHEVSSDGVPGAANLVACSNAIGVLNGGRGGTTIPAADRQGVWEHLAAHLRDGDREPPELQASGALRAHAAPDWKPPEEWFKDPGLSVPTSITIDSSGRIYGHAAQWGTCHIGFSDQCVSPPREDSHPYFTTGELMTQESTTVSVGQITVGTSHAPLNMGSHAAAEHYDHTGWAVADVAVGNDKHGIWVAGAVRPDADASRVHDLRASGQVSGDWRRIGGKLRLVGLLAVNVPGFPVPKMRARVASGAQYALVAAGKPTVSRGPSLTETQAIRIVMDMMSERIHGKGE